MSSNSEIVMSLIGKAGRAANAVEALQYSQAALNAANAIITLAEVPKKEII